MEDPSPGDDPLEPIAKKTYYSIGEVGELTGLKAHVLRYWESQFEMIAPTKNRAGNRVYRAKEIESILLVKHLLYEKRYTIEGARQKLKQMRKDRELGTTREQTLEPALIQEIDRQLREILDILTVP